MALGCVLECGLCDAMMFAARVLHVVRWLVVACSVYVAREGRGRCAVAAPTVARAAQVALSICMLHVVVTVVQRLSYVARSCAVRLVLRALGATRRLCLQLLEQLLVAH
jgi:hypothetical protein